MVAHYILLREHLVERRGGTFSTRGKTHQSQAIEGSLWFAANASSLPRTGTHGVITLRSHEFEEDLLECPLGHVERLTGFQLQLLSAVKSCKDRIKLFSDKRWLSDIERIDIGCVVFLVNTSDVPEKTPAKVKYIGELPSQTGIWFGVELSRQHHGRGRSNGNFKGKSFFKCPLDAGLFVSAQNLQICPTPSLFQESASMASSQGYSTYQVPAPNEGNIEHLYTNISVAPPLENPPLSIGERVVWISDTGPELGFVKWIGILPDSRVREYTIGLEFDKPIGTGTGKYNNHQLFRARQNHASLVPVLGLMKATEYYGDDVPPPPEFPVLPQAAVRTPVQQPPSPPMLQSPCGLSAYSASNTGFPSPSYVSYQDVADTKGFYAESSASADDPRSTYAPVITATRSSEITTPGSIYDDHDPMYENVSARRGKEARTSHQRGSWRAKEFSASEGADSATLPSISSSSRMSPSSAGFAFSEDPDEDDARLSPVLPKNIKQSKWGTGRLQHPAPTTRAYHAGNSVFYNRVNSEETLLSSEDRLLQQDGSKPPSESSPLDDMKHLRADNLQSDLPSPSLSSAAESATWARDLNELRLQPEDPTYCEVSRTLPTSSWVTGNVRNGNHVRTGSHGNSLATDGADQLVKVSPSQVGSEFELDTMVEVINGPPECRYGVIRWMGHPKTEPTKLIAGLEMEEESSAFTDGHFRNERCFTCPSNKAFFVYTHKLKRDSRFDESASFIERRDSQAFGAMACPDLEGEFRPPSASDLERFVGRDKGIQGHHNSCYMDAMLFSMYAFSMVFDSILFRPKRSDDIKDYDRVQKVLREGIVNPLRSNFFVRADKVLNLRKLLDKCSSVKGLMTEEKDPEEFLKSLLQETLKAEPFLHLSSGQECFHYQLFMEKQESIVLPTTQQLLELSFLQSDIKLAKTPPCLILQMPRFGKDFKMYSRIVPSLKLDITDIMLNYPRECTICGRLASHECPACYQHFGDSLDKIAFCANCLKKSHSHCKRTSHTPRPLQIDPDYLRYYDSNPEAAISREVLELFAVICIATSHYVAFVKCGNDDSASTPWVFFDSMADRMGTKHGYNVPEVHQCHFLPEWLKEKQRTQILQVSDDKQLPEQMKRLLCDSYICMYQSPSLLHHQ